MHLHIGDSFDGRNKRNSAGRSGDRDAVDDITIRSDRSTCNRLRVCAVLILITDKPWITDRRYIVIKFIHGEWIASLVRQTVNLLLRDDLSSGRTRRVDQRSRAAYLDSFAHCSHGKRFIHRRGLFQIDNDSSMFDSFEILGGEGHRIGSGIDGGKEIATCAIGAGGTHQLRSGVCQLNVHTRDHRPQGIRNTTAHTTVFHLSMKRRGHDSKQ